MNAYAELWMEIRATISDWLLDVAVTIRSKKDPDKIPLMKGLLEFWAQCIERNHK